MKDDKLDVERDARLDGAETTDADEPDDVDAVQARTPKPRSHGRVRENPRPRGGRPVSQMRSAER